MLKLNRLEISNFQKHEHLIIDFSDNVNILFGKSDSGKSSIRRAIEFLLGWNICDGLRRIGSKQTNVKGWFSNGVILERIRSSSINRYILQIKDDIKEFNAIGKSIPEEIITSININPLEIDNELIYLNSYPQISLPFLFDKSPTQRMKIFNKLTGNEILDKLFVQFNKDILKINRDLKETKESNETQEQILKEKEIELDRIKFQYSKAKKALDKINELNDLHLKLINTFNLIEDNKEALLRVKSDLKNIKIPQHIDYKQLIEKNDKIKILLSLKTALESTHNIKDIEGQLLNLRLPEVKFIEQSRVKNDRLSKLSEIAEKYEINGTSLDKVLTKQLPDVILDLEGLKQQFKGILKEAKICPLCSSELTEEHVSTLKCN